MPFAAVQRPSLGLGLLSSALTHHGISNEVRYANLDFAERVGLPAYKLIDLTRNDDLVGEWVFAPAAFREQTPPAEGFWDCVDLDPAGIRFPDRQAIVATFHKLREEATLWIEEMARSLLLPEPPRILGASSMFQQHCASLAVLRRVKELAPEVITILGGANCEGNMGRATYEAFDWLDCVVCGEADDCIVEVIESLLQGEPRSLPPGVLRRSRDPNPQRQRELIRDLDPLPVPDFHSYFATLAASALAPLVSPGLLMETSRGCWWGQKHHCTFCGLNASGMVFRAKSAERVRQELEELSDRYQLYQFEFTDNILAMERFRDLLPGLSDSPYTMFAEVKANLKREHLQTLARAGVRWIQPGLESLNDEVLRLMDKGTTAAVNLQLLKWAREFGVFVSWNFLIGFPGEKEEWYSEMAGWLPLLSHLQPPQGVFKMRFDRYSPYQSQPERYGIRLQPHPSYQHVYPVGAELLAELAYFHLPADQAWDPTLNDPVRMGPGPAALNREVYRWGSAFWGKQPVILSMVDQEDQLSILDTRPVARQRRHSLDGEARRVYLACETARGLKACAAEAGLEESRAQEILSELCQQLLTLALPDGRFLSLAVAGELPRLLRPEEFPGGSCRVAPGLLV
jgi:ribosomal peptide maturation radical SAM protein 1